MSTLRLAVIGASGRMGRSLIRLIGSATDVRLVAAVTVAGDPALGQDAAQLGGLERPLGVKVTETLSATCDAAIEFTTPAACAAWAGRCAAASVPFVTGTTGLEPQHEDALAQAARRIPVVAAPNMSVGINLLLGLVRQAAARLGLAWDVEIVEAHHRRKVDAPSGTALALAEAVCAGRGQERSAALVHGRAGQVGPRPEGQVGMHAVRLGSVVGDHDVHFASESEIITLSHRAQSRDAFAAGAIRAAQWAVKQAPGRYTMQDVLGLK